MTAPTRHGLARTEPTQPAAATLLRGIRGVSKNEGPAHYKQLFASLATARQWRAASDWSDPILPHALIRRSFIINNSLTIEFCKIVQDFFTYLDVLYPFIKILPLTFSHPVYIHLYYKTKLNYILE